MSGEQTRAAWRFEPDWRTTLFTLLLLPLFIYLGFWQLARADEKRELLALYEQRRNAAPVALSRLDTAEDLAHTAVALRGHFDNEHTLLLDNRIHQGRFGYEVVIPFVLSDGEGVVFVNRGWIAGDRGRRRLPTVPPVEGEQQLTGVVYVPAETGLSLAEPATDAWPRVRQQLDIGALAEELGVRAFPYEVRLREGQPALLSANWPPVNMPPAKHLAYAAQWFTMALALALLYLHLNSNTFSRLRRKARQE